MSSLISSRFVSPKNLKTVSPILYPFGQGLNCNSISTLSLSTLQPESNIQLTAVVQRCSSCGIFAESFSITKIAFHVQNWVTQGSNITVGVWSISATGVPSAALSEVSVAITAAGRYEVTLPSAVTITAGTPYAIAFVGDGTQSYNISTSGIFGGTPWLVYGSSTTWATKVATRMPLCFAALGTDGVYRNFAFSRGFSLDEITVAFDSGTTPDEVGNVFVAPFDCLVSGFWGILDINLDGSFKLYDSSNNLLTSFAVDLAYIGTTIGAFASYPCSPVKIYKGQTYRATYVPASVGTDTKLAYGSYASTAEKTMFCGNLDLNNTLPSYTSRSDAGSWTETTTKIAYLGIIVGGLYL